MTHSDPLPPSFDVGTYLIRNPDLPQLSDPVVAKRASEADISIVALQTADPFRYAPMLAVTQRNVVDYCRRNGFSYQAFVGISRGFHPWQASYNRIPLIQALLDGGYRGWVLYLDADAYIADLDFDLITYLKQYAHRAAILATSGVSEARWDVNDGVMLVNLGHPEGRRLIEQWTAKFARLSDDRLRAAEQWLDDDNDQDLLHQILREDVAIADAVRIESRDLLNSENARFIRQHLRSQTPDLAERTRAIAAEIGALGDLDADAPGQPEPGRAWSERLGHPVGHEPDLVTAPDAAPPSRSLIGQIVARWRDAPGDADIPAYQREFAVLLENSDIDALSAMLAGIGRASMSQGVLGGARQHERARNRLFARRLALSTYDRLVSLAEAVGARDEENPEMGPWGVNSAARPADLFDGVERAIGVDLSPPATVGGYLGIEVGQGRIVHARMLDAIHAAWRLRDLCRLHDLSGIVDIGGGVGLAAWYAARLGIGRYTIIAAPIAGALQGAVLGDVAATARIWPDDAGEALFNQDSLPEMAPDAAIALLRTARERGARLFLSINPDGRTGSGGGALTPVRDLVAAAGGWQAAGRHRHWLRAGHVEEVWLAE